MATYVQLSQLHFEGRLEAAKKRAQKLQAGGYLSQRPRRVAEPVVLHLTGNYPTWWTGRRFDRPIQAWAAGDTGKTVREILKGKKGSIKQAALDPGSPSWDDIMDMPWEEIVDRAQQRQLGYKTFKKLLGETRFDR